MTLVRVTLASGRVVDLTHLTTFSTYGGLIEGYPSQRTNDALTTRLGRRRQFAGSSLPAYVITPTVHRPAPDLGAAEKPFGPVEALPPVCCEGFFRSEPVAGELDAALHESRLVVAWFQHDLAKPVADFVAVAMHDLAWDDLAEDAER